MANPAYFVAFGFGVGLLRPGSGTWGSILALLMWPFMSVLLPWSWLGIFILALFVLGCVATGRASKSLGVEDHVGIVWDEMVAVWSLCWALPQHWAILLIAFVLFRSFDVMKPFPIRKMDDVLKGGLGIMLDDVMAALYAWLVTVTGTYVLILLGVSVS